MHRMILYSPALVLAVWCLLAAVDVRGKVVTVCGLAATALALALAEVERERRGRA